MANNGALEELLRSSSWEWEPEISNSNGREPGYWMYCGDAAPEDARAEFTALQAENERLKNLLKSAYQRNLDARHGISDLPNGSWELGSSLDIQISEALEGTK